MKDGRTRIARQSNHIEIRMNDPFSHHALTPNRVLLTISFVAACQMLLEYVHFKLLIVTFTHILVLE